MPTHRHPYHWPSSPPFGACPSPDHPPQHHGEAGSRATPFIAAVKVSRGELCQQSPRVTAPPAWPQDTKGKFPFISSSTAPGLFLPPIVMGSQRQRGTFPRDREAGIQRLKGQGQKQCEIWEDQGVWREKPSHKKSDAPRKRPIPPATESNEIQRRGTTKCPLGLFGPTLFILPGKLRPRERKENTGQVSQRSSGRDQVKQRRKIRIIAHVAKK